MKGEWSREETARDEVLGGRGVLPESSVERFTLLPISPEDPNASPWVSAGPRCAIGSHPANDLILGDRTVSRFHCEIVIDAAGARVRDLESRNGTYVDGVRVSEGWLRHDSLLRLGQSEVRFRLAGERLAMRTSPRTHFGTLVGHSVAMRSAFAMLELASASNATVLIEGETGTGKEEASFSLHDASARSGKPFVIIDCSAIPPNLLESELFGHERGAFTGALHRRLGAFEEADGGTVFIDEVGELPLELQPKLLRVLERKTVRRVGENAHRPVDVRVVAATNRNLRSEVNKGRFRADLYYRLAVVNVRLPPLRERPEDLAFLVERILDSLAATIDQRRRLLTPEFFARLQRGAWPGNVRQLRNYIEQCLVLDELPPMEEEWRSPSSISVDPRLSYAEARRRALDAFERAYLQRLLELHGGSVSEAARAAGINRVYMHRLLRRHALRG